MEQDWINAFIGGGLIGLASTILLLVNGKIAGISGIVSGVILPEKGDFFWRLSFVLGLLGGGLIASLFMDNPFVQTSNISLMEIALAGILVGFGTRLGSGCTSGHGVCGISRLSVRSIVATVSFIIAGALTVALASYFRGGSL